MKRLMAALFGAALLVASANVSLASDKDKGKKDDHHEKDKDHSKDKKKGH